MEGFIKNGVPYCNHCHKADCCGDCQVNDFRFILAEENEDVFIEVED